MTQPIGTTHLAQEQSQHLQKSLAASTSFCWWSPLLCSVEVLGQSPASAVWPGRQGGQDAWLCHTPRGARLTG